MFKNVFQKMVHLSVKKFHELHDDLKIIWKEVNPWPLSCTYVLTNLKKRRVCGKSDDDDEEQSFEGTKCTCFLCLDPRYELRLKEDHVVQTTEPQALDLPGMSRLQSISSERTDAMTRGDYFSTHRFLHEKCFCFYFTLFFSTLKIVLYTNLILHEIIVIFYTNIFLH